MIAAIYARKSNDDSDRDAEARSCERQIEHAKLYAAAQGWTVGPIFRDDAVSGAEWKHRPGWTALLAALSPTPPFACLIVSELSRIGRDSVRTPAAVLAVEEAGIDIHSYLNRGRISLADEAGEMSTMLGSLLASFERRRASDRTRDALRRRFEAGAATGGAAFGYQIERNGGPFAHYVIDPIEAAVVRNVFEWYDEGAGLGTIAKRLTAARVPAPRGGTSWAVGPLRLMLRRETYAGRRAFARTMTSHAGGTKNQRSRPAAEWQAREQPELQIVDRELFERVQARLEGRASSFLRGRSGRLIGRPRGDDANPSHLLSGLLVCARCGRAIGPVVGRPGSARYACASYHRRGVAACGNGLRVKVAALDAAVIEAVAARLASDVVAEAVRGAVVLLNAGQEEARGRRTAIAAELATIATRERRLLDALVDGDTALSVSIKGRMRDELARRDALAAELEAIETAKPLNAEALVRDVETRAADLRGLLHRHPAQARQVLRLVLAREQFQCVPYDDARGRGYDVKATGTYAPL